MGWVSNPGVGLGGTNSWTGVQTFTGNGLVITDPTTASSGVQFGTTFYGRAADGSFGITWGDTNVTRVGAGLAKVSDGSANHDAQIGYLGSPAAPGLLLRGGGTNLYSDAAATLKTDHTFQPISGLVSPTAVSVNNYVAGQAPATSTQGTDTTPVSGTIFFGQVFIPANTTITGISYLIGTVGGTNNVIVGLYNNAGTLVKNSSLSGTLVGTLATMQRVPFTATYAATGPAMYWVSVSMNGTTARLRTHTFGDHAAGSATGVFGTLGNISPVTTFTANTAPYAMTY